MVIEGMVEHCGLDLEKNPEAVDSRPGSCWPGWWKRPYDDPDITIELKSAAPVADVRLPGLGIENTGVAHQLLPGMGRVDVDLYNTRVGGDLQALQTFVRGRVIAFQRDGQLEFRGGVLNGRQQVQPVEQIRQRRQEHEQVAVAGFHAQCGAHKVTGFPIWGVRNLLRLLARWALPMIDQAGVAGVHFTEVGR